MLFDHVKQKNRIEIGTFVEAIHIQTNTTFSGLKSQKLTNKSRLFFLRVFPAYIFTTNVIFIQPTNLTYKLFNFAQHQDKCSWQARSSFVASI